MSVALALEIETERLDRVIADVLVTPFFACDRPLRGPAARADWRLCGMISDRLERAELTGELGEAAIFPTGGRMRAPLLLAIGLGPRPDFGEAALRELARGAARKLLGLRSGIAVAREVALAPNDGDLAAVLREERPRPAGVGVGCERQRASREGLGHREPCQLEQRGRHVDEAHALPHQAGTPPPRSGAPEQRNPDLVEPRRVPVGEVVAVFPEGLAVICGQQHRGGSPEQPPQTSAAASTIPTMRCTL